MITYEISGKTASNVDVVLHLPSDRLPNLLLLLERVDRLSTAVEDQQKRVQAILEAGRQRVYIMDREIVKQYVQLIDEGRCPVDSISITLKSLKTRFPNLYYDGVKQTLAAAGVLKNVGYYTALKERNHKEA